LELIVIKLDELVVMYCHGSKLLLYDFGQVALPRETTTGKCFLQHYIESILSLQEASCKMVDGMYSTLYLYGLMTCQHCLDGAYHF
jgi:hypothetical protein